VIGEVACGEGAEGRLHRPKPHGARREVDDLRVLAPARIRLEPAERPQLAQVVGAQPPEEVLNRVEGGRGVRFERDHVALAQVVEIERGQQAHRGGRGGLVAADLRPVGVRAQVVGVVDHPRRQPQHPALDALQDREIRVLHGEAS
jgi:hypothetical protein